MSKWMVSIALLLAANMAAADDSKDKDKSVRRTVRQREVPKTVRQIRELKVDTKKEYFLGVTTEKVPETLAAQFPDQLAKGRGLVITGVTAKSAAEQAGLKRNDILLSVNGQDVSSSEQLRKIIVANSEGKKMKLAILRGGEAKTIEAAPKERQSTRWLGMDPKEYEKLRALRADAVQRKTSVEQLKKINEAAEIGEKVRSKVAHRLEANKGLRSLRLQPSIKQSAVSVQIVQDSTSVSVVAKGSDDVSVEVNYKEKNGTSVTKSFSGKRADVLKKLDSIPETQRAMVKQALQIKATHNVPGSYEIRVVPMLDRDAGTLNLELQSSEAKKKQAVKKPRKESMKRIRVEGTIDVDEILKQLGDVPDEVRRQVERTLRSIEIPQTNVKFEKSQ